MTGVPQPRMGHLPPPYITPGAQPQPQYPITYAPQAYAPPQAQQRPPPNMQPPHSTGVTMRQPTTPSKY